jgi:purine-binding chemotaxis protein CheW
MAEVQLVLFRLGKERFGISITQVKEIILFQEVTKLPTAPAYIEGIISLRGKIIPVVNLAMKLEMHESKTGEKKVLIVETDSKDVGILVDDVTEVICLQDNAIELPPVTNKTRYITGIGKADDRLLILLDVDELFSQDEMKALIKIGC